MKYKLIALDLDGTALRSDGSRSEDCKEARLSAHESRRHIVVASGRSWTSLPKEVLSLPCVEYAVTSDGAVVYDVKHQKQLQAFYLKEEAVEGLLRIAEEAGVMVEGFLNGIPYAGRDYVENPEKFGAGPRAAVYVRRTRRPAEQRKHRKKG